jgi:large subunit ribosomal protein L25
MPDRPKLAASRRTVTGKAVSRLRREGHLPAVVYGHGMDSESVSLDTHEFEVLRRRTASTTLIDLTVEGGKARPVLVHGIQVHPVTRRPLHVDLFAVRMTEELTVEVPLVGTGIAPAVDSGGTLVHMLATVKIRALPANLPEMLTYDLSPLDSYDASITVADLVVPDGVVVQAEPTEVLARVLPPRVEEVPVAPEAEAAEAEGEAAEGEKPEGTAPTQEASAEG